MSLCVSLIRELLYFLPFRDRSRRALLPPLLTSRKSAEPCFQRYFAAVGVIFQQGRASGAFFLPVSERANSTVQSDVLAYPRRDSRLH